MYSSPAVGAIPGAGRMLFVGSYDHRLYALDADNGKRRWAYDVGGQIPGSPTVIGTTVYTSSFDTSKTVGLDASNGKPVWEWGADRHLVDVARALRLDVPLRAAAR